MVTVTKAEGLWRLGEHSRPPPGQAPSGAAGQRGRRLRRADTQPGHLQVSGHTCPLGRTPEGTVAVPSPPRKGGGGNRDSWDPNGLCADPERAPALLPGFGSVARLLQSSASSVLYRKITPVCPRVLRMTYEFHGKHSLVCDSWCQACWRLRSVSSVLYVEADKALWKQLPL